MSAADRTGLNRSCAATLTGWVPPSPAQQGLRLRYLEHLRHNLDGWSRSCLPHLTASSLVYSAEGPSVLLTLHAKLGRWLQTGGHLEPGDESLQAAALRESREESGLDALTLDATPLLLSEHPLSCAGRPTTHLDVQFLAHSTSRAEPGVSAESLDVRWFSADALPEVDQTVRDLVEAAARRVRGA